VDTAALYARHTLAACHTAWRWRCAIMGGGVAEAGACYSATAQTTRAARGTADRGRQSAAPLSLTFPQQDSTLSLYRLHTTGMGGMPPAKRALLASNRKFLL